MTQSPPRGATPYETWVLTLRAWQRDPMTSLDELPILSADTFTPETYQRLRGHIEIAMDTVGKAWSEGIQRAMRKLLTPFDFGRELVSMRALLARQWQLASHSSLPEELRRPLSDGVRRKATSAQADLERGIAEHISGALDRPAWEAALSTLRNNSLDRVTQYSVGDDGRMNVTLAIPDVPPSTTLATPASTRRRFAHRRLFEE